MHRPTQGSLSGPRLRPGVQAHRHMSRLRYRNRQKWTHPLGPFKWQGNTCQQTLHWLNWRTHGSRMPGCSSTRSGFAEQTDPWSVPSGFTEVHQHAYRHRPIDPIALNLRISFLHILTINTRCRRQRHSGSSSAAEVSPACQQRLPSERPTERLQFSNDQRWRLRSALQSHCNRMPPVFFIMY